MATLTEKDYCDYDTCVALKELGYIGQGRCYYDLDKDKNQLRHFGIQVLTTRSAEALNFVLAVHLYEAQKWLREEKKIEANASFDKTEDGWIAFIQRLDYPDLIGTDFLTPIFNSYEDALLEGIKEAIKLFKEEK